MTPTPPCWPGSTLSRSAASRRSSRTTPASGRRNRTRPGLQRLSRAVPASERDRRRSSGPTDLGRRRDGVPTGHRKHGTARRIRGELADFVGAQSALVFSSGYTANLGAVVGLSGPGALLVSTPTRMPRSSTPGGSRAGWRSHRTETRPRWRPRWRRVPRERAVVITDSVFSTDGALAPLQDLYEVCRRHRALMLVDEAHGLGVRGRGGCGLVHESGWLVRPMSSSRRPCRKRWAAREAWCLVRRWSAIT